MKIRIKQLKNLIESEIRKTRVISESTIIDDNIQVLTNAIRDFYINVGAEEFEEHERLVAMINSCVEAGIELGLYELDEEMRPPTHVTKRDPGVY